MIAVIRIITFAIEPNFASCQELMMSICEIIAGIMTIMGQAEFFRRNNTVPAINNKAAISQKTPNGFEISFVNWLMVPKLKAFANPITWMMP